jgi:hypothetical protein
LCSDFGIKTIQALSILHLRSVLEIADFFNPMLRHIVIDVRSVKEKISTFEELVDLFGSLLKIKKMLEFASVSVTTILGGDVSTLGAVLTLVSESRIGTDSTRFGFGDKWTRAVFYGITE